MRNRNDDFYSRIPQFSNRVPCVVDQGCGEVALLPGQVTRLPLYKERKKNFTKKEKIKYDRKALDGHVRRTSTVQHVLT